MFTLYLNSFKQLNVRIKTFAKQTVVVWIAKCKYFIRRLKVRVIFFTRRIFYWLGHYSENFYRIFYVVLVLSVFLLIYSFGPHPLLNKDEANQFFTTAGAMIGGAVAIIFTLSVFALQTAAERYSASIFRIYANNHLERIIFYILSLFAVILFSLGLLYGSIPIESPVWVFDLGAYFGLSVIGISFLLIQWLYVGVKHRVDPETALVILRKTLQKKIKLIKKDAERIAFVSQPADGVSEVMFEKLNLTAAHQTLNQHLMDVDSSLNELFEITRKLIDRGEIENANLGLKGISATICEYLMVRSGSAVVLPASVLLATTSDVNQFVVNNLERFVSLGEQQLKDGHEIVVQYIIRQLVQMAKYANEMEFVNNPNHDNPVLGTIAGYLKQFLKKVAAHQKLDGLLEGIRATSQIGNMMVEKHNDVLLFGWHEDMHDLAICGLILRQDFLTEEAQNLWLQLLKNIVSSEFFNAKLHFKVALENFSTITLMHRKTLLATGIQKSMAIQNIQNAPYSVIKDLLRNIAINFDKFPETNQKYILDIYIDLVQELYRTLRDLSTKIKSADDLFAGEVADIVDVLGETMLYLAQQDAWKTEKTELLSQVKWFIHLPYWFCAPTEKIDDTHAFWNLVDAIAKVGIVAMSLGQIDVVSSAFDAIDSIARKFLKDIPSVNQFTEPRIMLKSIYLGILALKNGQDDLFIKVGLQIFEFEKAYRQKHLLNLELPNGIDPEQVSGLPKKDQLLREVWRWQSDFSRNKYNRHGLMNDAEDQLLDVVEEIDIDRFVFEVWGCFVVGGQIEKEINAKNEANAKRSHIQYLVQVLTKNTNK
jgi:hypothetical protein